MMNSSYSINNRHKITLTFEFKSSAGGAIPQKRYEFTIDFSVEKKFSLEKKTEEARKLIQDNVIRVIDNKDMRTLVNDPNAHSIFTWVIRRINGYFPKNNIIFSSIAFREEDTPCLIYENVVREALSINSINGNIIKRIKETTLSEKGKLDLLLQLIKLNNLKSNSNEQVNNFTSTPDFKKIKNMILSSERNTLVILDYICPPYINDKSKGYIDLFVDVNEDTSQYNFNYDYHNNIDVLNKVVTLFRLAGFECVGKVVLCDWGLINIQGIRTTLKMDSLITEKLTTFYMSLTRLVKARYDQIQVLRLTDFGVDKYLPIGLPTEIVDIKNYLLSLSKNNHFDIIDLIFLEKLLSWVNDDNLKRYLIDWRNYKELNSWGEMKGELINVLKTYSNIVWILLKKKKVNLNIENAISYEHNSLRLAAYYDALIRYVEYKIYAKIVSPTFSSPICLYQDPGFPMAGNHFRTDKMPVLFLDPESILNLTF